VLRMPMRGYSTAPRTSRALVSTRTRRVRDSMKATYTFGLYRLMLLLLRVVPKAKGFGRGGGGR
jgi:hypothetical protein